MNNKPHTEATKKKMSESQKKRWASMTAEERTKHKRRIREFWEKVEASEKDEKMKRFEEEHKQYIWEEFNRLFGGV